MKPSSEVGVELGRLSRGERAAFDRLVPLLYDELRQLARQQLRGERVGHTLSSAALVNEVYLKLLRNEHLRLADRKQFFAAAAATMRRILVDYARSRLRDKRGGGAPHLPMEEVEAFLSERQASELLALEEAMGRLGQLDPRAARVVAYRFFVGLSVEETAAALEVSTKTVQRAWIAARAWLRREVGQELGAALDDR